MYRTSRSHFGVRWSMCDGKNYRYIGIVLMQHSTTNYKMRRVEECIEPSLVKYQQQITKILCQEYTHMGEPQSLLCSGGPRHESSMRYLHGKMGGKIGVNSGTHGYGFTLLIDEEFV